MSPQVSSARMIFTMTLIATICGGLIVWAYQYTLPMIERNKAIRVQEAVLAILPQAKTVEMVEDKAKNTRFFVGKDSLGHATGVAIEAQGQGFADVIHALYAYDPTTHKITGFKVVESKETPGIGDKITSDTLFLANFRALDVTHAIVAVKHGMKTAPWQIDGITGATISSKGVARFLQKSVSERTPAIDTYWEATLGK